MRPPEFLQTVFRRLGERVRPAAVLRTTWWRFLGASIAAGTLLPRVRCTWPHQISLGRGCTLEEDVFFKFDGLWRPGPAIVVGDRVFLGRGCEFNIRERVYIGRDALIASGCKFIDHDHETSLSEQPMNTLGSLDGPILLEEDVWLGVNVVVLKGVTIGRGAVVGAGAVVTRSIPPCEIWAGIPARKIGERAPQDGPESSGNGADVDSD